MQLTLLPKNKQKQPPSSVPGKRCSENMQQIYRRTPIPKCDFNKLQRNFIEIALLHGCSPVILLHIFRKPFPKNTSGWLLLNKNLVIIFFVGIVRESSICRVQLSFKVYVYFISKQKWLR